MTAAPFPSTALLVDPEHDSTLQQTLEACGMSVTVLATFRELCEVQPTSRVELVVVGRWLPDVPVLTAIDHAQVRWGAVTILAWTVPITIDPQESTLLSAIARDSEALLIDQHAGTIASLMRKFSQRDPSRIVGIARRLGLDPHPRECEPKASWPKPPAELDRLEHLVPDAAPERKRSPNIRCNDRDLAWLEPLEWYRNRRVGVLVTLALYAQLLNIGRRLPLIPAPGPETLFSDMTMLRFLTLEFIVRSNSLGRVPKRKDAIRALGGSDPGVRDAIDRFVEAHMVVENDRLELRSTSQGRAFLETAVAAIESSHRAWMALLNDSEQRVVTLGLEALMAAAWRQRPRARRG